jgi:hypothetical protein
MHNAYLRLEHDGSHEHPLLRGLSKTLSGLSMASGDSKSKRARNSQNPPLTLIPIPDLADGEGLSASGADR